MSCYICAVSSYYERTFFHQVDQGDYVEIFNEEKIFNSDGWTCTKHIITLKNLFYSFSKLSWMMSKEDEELSSKYLSYLKNCGKHKDLDEPLALQIVNSTLSKSKKGNLAETRLWCYSGVWKSVTLLWRIWFFDCFWGKKQCESQFLVTPKAILSPTGSPATVSNHLGNMTPSLCLAPKKKRKLTALEKAQKYLDFI